MLQMEGHDARERRRPLLDATIRRSDAASFQSPEFPARGPGAALALEIPETTDADIDLLVEFETRPLTEPSWRYCTEVRTRGRTQACVRAEGLDALLRVRFTFGHSVPLDGAARVVLPEPLWLPESRSTP